MMKANEVAEVIKEYVDEVKIVNERRVFATTDKERCRDAMVALTQHGVQHLSTISGVDRGDTITVVYHLDCMPTLLSLKLNLPKNTPTVKTVTDIFPGAILYERDIMEMLGIKVEDHPEPRRLFLPDDWPSKVYPLRKEAKK